MIQSSISAEKDNVTSISVSFSPSYLAHLTENIRGATAPSIMRSNDCNIWSRQWGRRWQKRAALEVLKPDGGYVLLISKANVKNPGHDVFSSRILLAKETKRKSLASLAFSLTGFDCSIPPPPLFHLLRYLKAGPLDLSFWTFLTLLCHGIEKVQGYFVWKWHKKFKGKVG